MNENTIQGPSSLTTSAAFNAWYLWSDRQLLRLFDVFVVLLLLQSASYLWDMSFQVGYYHAQWQSEVLAACKRTAGCLKVDITRDLWNPKEDRVFFNLVGAHSNVLITVKAGAETSSIEAIRAVRGAESNRHINMVVKTA